MSRKDLNRANTNTIGDQLNQLKLGDLFLGQLNQTKRKLNPTALGVGSYTLATLHALRVPDRSRAAVVHRATVRAGGVTGELTPVAYGATPTTGQIAVAPNGDIVVLAADAITDMDLVYTPERGEVLETTFPVVSNVLTFPTAGPWARGVSLLLEAEGLVGTATGKKIVVVPGNGATSAGQAKLNLAKATVIFNGTDAITRARVRVLLAATVANELQTVLDETDDTI